MSPMGQGNTKIRIKKRAKVEGQQPRALFIPRVKPSVSDETPVDPWETALKAYDGKKTPKAGKKTGKQKADAKVSSNAAEVEDDLGLFGSLQDGAGIISPPVTPTDLEIIVAKNTILPALVDAMEVNIDGTGWEIIPKDPEMLEPDEEPEEGMEEEEDEGGKTTTGGPPKPPTPPKPKENLKPKAGKDEEKDDEEEGDFPFEPGPNSGELAAKAQALADKQKEVDLKKAPLEDFFNECWPGMSFLTVRRKLRRDQEKVGYAFLEVMRNDAGEIMVCRRLDPKKLRLVRLDDAEFVERVMQRDGKDFTLEISLRARRFVQIIGRKIVWFKEFGETRDIDQDTGKYGPKGSLQAEKRGTEILYLKNKEDVATPYGIPRWMSNVPSVIGSRKAEEFNLEFFDSGGIPPMMILVQGGSLATDVEQQIRDSFLASGASKHQAAILEAYAVGDMDSAKNVRVTVERFGSEQQKDSMFEMYGKTCDARVQRSFRMPSIFLGMSEDFSFATAFASYTVAEAQVFEPERKEFDELINLMLMPQLPNGKDFIFRSLPLAVRDTAQQIDAATLVKEMIEPTDFVESVNDIVNTSFQPKSEEAIQRDKETEKQEKVEEFDRMQEMNGNNTQEPGTAPPGKPQPGKPPPAGGTNSVQKGIDELEELATKGAALMQKGFGDAQAAQVWLAHKERVGTLKDADRATYEALLAAKTFSVVENDPKGMAEIAGCTAEVLAANQ